MDGEERTCQKCSWRGGGKFCNDCGQPLFSVESVPSSSNQQWWCPKCAKESVGNFCMECGFDAKDAKKQEPTSNEPVTSTIVKTPVESDSSLDEKYITKTQTKEDSYDTDRTMESNRSTQPTLLEQATTDRKEFKNEKVPPLSEKELKEDPDPDEKDEVIDKPVVNDKEKGGSGEGAIHHKAGDETPLEGEEHDVASKKDNSLPTSDEKESNEENLNKENNEGDNTLKENDKKSVPNVDDGTSIQPKPIDEKSKVVTENHTKCSIDEKAAMASVGVDSLIATGSKPNGSGEAKMTITIDGKGSQVLTHVMNEEKSKNNQKSQFGPSSNASLSAEHRISYNNTSSNSTVTDPLTTPEGIDDLKEGLTGEGSITSNTPSLTYAHVTSKTRPNPNQGSESRKGPSNAGGQSDDKKPDLRPRTRYQHTYDASRNSTQKPTEVKFYRICNPNIRRITVKFYAAIPSSWKGRVLIYGGSFLYWKEALMELERYSINREMKEGTYDLLYGEAQIPCSQLNRVMPYKYVVIDEKTGNCDYEYLYTTEFSAYMNRVLFIQPEQRDYQVYHQIDDIILMEPPRDNDTKQQSNIRRLYNFFTGSGNKDGDITENMKNTSVQVTRNMYLWYLKECLSGTMKGVENYETKMQLLRSIYTGFFQAFSIQYNEKYRWKKLPIESVQILLRALNTDMTKYSNEGWVGYLNNLCSTVVLKEVLIPDNFEYNALYPAILENLSIEKLAINPNEKLLDNLTKEFSEPALKAIFESLLFLWKRIVIMKNIVEKKVSWCYPLVILHKISGQNDTINFPKKILDGPLDLRLSGLYEMDLKKNYKPEIFDHTFNNLRYLQNSLKVDKILQRSLLYLMAPRHFVKAFECQSFQKRTLLRSIIHSLKSNGLDDTTIEDLSTCMVMLKSNYKSNDNVGNLQPLFQEVDALTDLVILLLEKYIFKHSYELLTITIQALCTGYKYIEEKKEASNFEKFQKNIWSKLTSVLNASKTFLRKDFNLCSKSIDDIIFELQVLGQILRLNIFNEGDTKKLRDLILMETKTKLDRLCSNQPPKFVDVYTQTTIDHIFIQTLQAIFEKNIEIFIGQETYFNKIVTWNGSAAAIGRRMMERWNSCHDKEKKLEFCFTWHPMKSIAKYFAQRDRQDQSISNTMDEARNLIITTIHSLFDSSISFKVFDLLLTNKKEFFDFVGIFGNREHIEEVRRTFERLSNDYRDFKWTKSLLQEFVSILNDVPMLNLQKLKSSISSNLRDVSMNEVCSGDEKTLKFFQIDIEDMSVLEKYQKLVWYQQFQIHWRHCIREHSGNQMTLKMVIKKMFVPAIYDLKQMVQSIADMSISIHDILGYYEKAMTESDFKRMESEMNELAHGLDLTVNPQTFSESVRKIECVKNMKFCSEHTENILDASKQLELAGDFSNVVKVHNQVLLEDDMTLKDVSQEMIDDVKKINSVTDEMNRVIKAVTKNLAILKWLRDNLKDPKEVKVFVEMMSIAAGESDYEVDRVAYFEATCQAFAPIIFELGPESGFSKFNRACKTTAEQLKTDDKILEKLSDSNRNIEWFKNAKDSQGSVSTRSFLEAKQSNKYGTYTIGNLEGNISTYLENKATQNLVIKLEIPYEESGASAEGKVKRLYLDDIHDLQSRLMLLGRENKDDKVDEKSFEKNFFVKQAEMVTALGTAFVSLVEAGYVNSFDWKMVWKSDVDKAKEDGMEEFLNEMNTTMTKFNKHLEKWKTDVFQFRQTYPLANYFTIKQCLILQNYLHFSRKKKKNIAIDDKIYTLLYSISDTVSKEKIKQCLFAIHADSYTTTQKLEPVEESNFTRFSLAKINSYLSMLQDDFDIEENIALASLIAMPDISKEGKAIIWCKKMMDDCDEDEIESLSDKANKEIQRLKENALSDDERDDEDSSDLDDKPFLTLEEFGIFLQQFGDKRKEKVVRDYLNQDKPSLMLVPKDEIYSSLLAMYHNDGKGHLPESDEVIICSKNVSIEQIELLIMRAVYNDGGLYCLAFADELDYDASEHLFNFMQKLSSKGKMNPFVVMCSSESENHSYFVSILETYRVQQFYHNTKQTTKMLENYICLSVGADVSANEVHGAVVDENKFITRVITSSRGGMGKSLHIGKQSDKLKSTIENSTNVSMKAKLQDHTLVVRIPIHGTSVDLEDVVTSLSKYSGAVKELPTIYHFDVAPTVYNGLDELFFNALILGYLQTSTGKIWRKQVKDMCFVEFTDISKQPNYNKHKSNVGVILKMFPQSECASPEETYQISKGTVNEEKLLNVGELKTSLFQRVVQYLTIYDTNKQALNTFAYMDKVNIKPPKECLEVLLKYCGVKDPSWRELRNFVHFFHEQLIGCERSIYTSELVRQEFPGFKAFVIAFLLEMARDFATRSLSDSDKNNEVGVLVELKRTWEQSSHPYLFFNEDGSTMTFFGINISPNCHLIDQDKGTVIQENIIVKPLYDILSRQMCADFVNLQTSYTTLPRRDQIRILCRVMGLAEDGYDPDPSYELTIDNMKKILAIHMRLRCGVPVVLMGETGCGKTTLIRFMSALRAGQTVDENGKKPRNMVLVKVHGGITMSDIVRKVEQAKELAVENRNSNIMTTTLFLDEANTSDAIGLIKEVMVDGTVFGESLNLERSGLEIIAACNPYRKHTSEMIVKLESAGLGYHVGAVETYEKIGEIPLRQLVYRVHPLPGSMKPLVWDFGQLNAQTEEKYAKQIISRYEAENKLPKNQSFVQMLVKILAKSQQYMRGRKDECSFVSLRDVERAVQVTAWFYQNMTFLLPMMNKFEARIGIGQTESVDRHQASIEKQRRSLILALAVCYVARLEDRKDYIEYIVQYFDGDFALNNGEQQFEKEIERFQKMFVDELKLEDNIAKNQALCENVFMMVVCIELRIPLFVVGKPGSSKSLAKTIVQDNMQGNLSKSELFKHFKQVFMSSYQCSPLSTAEGIIGIFKQSARFQEGKNLDEYTSVVVLDEVGLAEDSPRMPLKALHPLLEDGTDGSEHLLLDGPVSKDKRVAFIGISNWALDPAKMNRGIMLSRSPPAFQELINTARDICAGDKNLQSAITPLLQPLAEGYMDVYEEQKNSEVLKQFKKEEFFGLRDFYSLVKMIFCYTRKFKGIPPVNIIEDAIKRNFSGMDEINAWSKFKTKIIPILEQEKHSEDSKLTTVDMIKQSFEISCPCSSVTGKKRCASNRYLLVMTEKYSALPIIEGMSLEEKDNITIIFGSSFPKDQEFTQVCRDINRIKMCMETGKTVVLLNMENLYESLYDALNQYYVFLGGQRYVDLGLGTHRVKCRVHEDFKLIVIADKDVVYDSFPIPLINRLEKHYLVTSTAMTKHEQIAEQRLKDWAIQHAMVSANKKQFNCDDAFIGYTEDTCASIVLAINHQSQTEDEVFEAGKRFLLQICTPEAIARLDKSIMEEPLGIYYEEQQHSSLEEFLNRHFKTDSSTNFVQITSFSRLLSQQELECLHLYGFQIHPLRLVQFQTEHSFREAFKNLCEKVSGTRSLIVIQYGLGNKSLDLVPCAQHICKEIASEYVLPEVYVLFLLQLNRGIKGLVSYQSTWKCVHIDEMRLLSSPSLVQCMDSPISSLFTDGKRDWLHIVRSSIQGAMKIVNEDMSMKTDMITQKIQFLLTLLDSETDQDFVNVVLTQIHEMMSRKETSMIEIFPEKVNNWVPTEAKELKYTPGYGTFGEALLRCVEEKISPILANFIKRIDVHDNLMILRNEDQNLKIKSRYQDLWMKFFVRIHSLAQDLNENNATAREHYTARFPFSSDIIQVTDEQLKLQSSDDYKTTFDDLLKALYSIPVGEVIMDVSDEECLMDYTIDLISSKHNGLPKPCIKILSTVLLRRMTKVISDLNDEDISDESRYQLCLPAINFTYNLFNKLFDNIVEILTIKPNIAKELNMRIHEENGEEIDLSALDLLIRSYLPSNAEGIKIDDIIASKEIGPIVNAIINDKSLGEVKTQRIMWAQLKILQIYTDDVIFSGNNDDANNTKSLDREVMHDLWKDIKQLGDPMESLKSWQILEDIVVTDYQKREKKEEHQQSNNFKENFLQFFVDVVTEFCFSKSKEAFDKIDPDVIAKIMGYAFKNDSTTTKRFSPLADYAVDQSPVIRSFILQQLLKKEVDVDIYLSRFLEENFRIAYRHNNNGEYGDYWNICKIFVYCYEDHLTSEANLLKINGNVTSTYLRHVSSSLANAAQKSLEKTSMEKPVEMLKNIAMLRMAIAAAAALLCKLYLEPDDEKTEKDDKPKLFATLMKFIGNATNSDAHMFLLRQIMYQYGHKELCEVIQKSEFAWIELQHTDEHRKDTKQDRYLVYGTGYKEIRESISDFHLQHGQNEALLRQVANKFKRQSHLVEMAMLHYNVFSEIVFDDDRQQTILKNLNVKNYLKYLNLKTVYNGNDDILELLYHLSVILDYSKSPAVTLLRSFVENAQVLQNCFLPTMPSDNFDAINAVLPTGNYTATTKHECPNGHPYVITDCGNPNEASTCPECRAPIGGAGGQYQTNRNRAITGNRDTTKTGHCIGAPNTRPTFAFPERLLSSTSVVCQRFLMHLSMLLGCITGQRELIGQIVTPLVNAENLITFFTDHLQCDIYLLGTIFENYNKDDLRLFLNLLLKSLIDHPVVANGNVRDINALKTKPGRNNYENYFNKTIIERFLQKLSKEMDDSKRLLMDDQRIGENILIKRLYEVDLPPCDGIGEVIPAKCYQLWSYRQTINIPHLRITLNKQNIISETKTKSLLSDFLDNEVVLSHLKDLPKLLEFQNHLHQTFSFKVDKKTAEKETLGEILHNFPPALFKKMKKISRDLTPIWKNLSHHLKKYGRVRIDQEHQLDTMGLKTPLAYFLPTLNGPGSCFMALIDFLAFNQNEVLTQYKKTPGANVKSSSLLELKESDMINYSPDRDLLPLIYTNCDYSLEIGKGTEVAYNFEQIQRHLVEKLCFGKSLFTIQIREFVYRDDVHNARKLTNLKRVIHQSLISYIDQKQMMLELTEVVDVSHSLYAAEISIGFLSSTITPNDREMPYKKYLENILHMDIDKYLPSQRMRSTIRLKHLTSMWLMLTVERAMKLDEQNQNPFNCDNQFMKELDEDMVNKSRTYLRHVEPFEVINLLTEFIVCGDISSLPDMEFSLKETLEYYEDTNEKDKSSCVERLPNLLQTQHLYCFWKEVAKAYKKKLVE